MNGPITRIYIDRDVRNAPVTRRFIDRFPGAEILICGSPADLSRLEKSKTAVYLGRRRGPLIKEFPRHAWYGSGGGCGWNLILGYNCVASCRYCFVQTIFDHPVPTIFADTSEMIEGIRAFLTRNPGAGVSTGEYADSLLFDDITGFTEALIPVFAKFPASTLELRTKSAHTGHLPRDPAGQILVSYSINPSDVIAVAEPGTPGLKTRLQTARDLHERGYRIALRIDPIIAAGEFAAGYSDLPDRVHRYLGWEKVTTVFLGILRFDAALLDRMSRSNGGRRLLDAEYVPCPDGLHRPTRHARTAFYRRVVRAIRACAPAVDISLTMEPDYVTRSVFHRV